MVKIFGSALLQPVCSVCVSLSAFSFSMFFFVLLLITDTMYAAFCKNYNLVKIIAAFQ